MTHYEWIRFQSIGKRFSKEHYIGNADLALRRGEIFALCGGNGAGKSTFIKIITGIMKGTSGKVIVNGKAVNTGSESYKKLFSYMPDHMAFPPQLTGEEALKFLAKLRKIKPDRVEEVLKLTGLYEVKDRPIKHYSKGMEQRLLFAQALLPDAPLLILDEPTNGLDPYWFFRFKEILLGEKQKGKTILFTTHVLSLVEEIADRAAFMEKGRIVRLGSLQAIVWKDGEKKTLEQIFFAKKEERAFPF